MVMAFDKLDPSIPTQRWLGMIYQLEDDGGFNGFIGKREDDYYYEFEREVFIQVPLENITESERHRIGRSVLFFCDVELDGEDLKNIRGIEFIEEEPLDIARMRAEADRIKQENPDLFPD